MSTVATVISLAAAICTTAANLPQLKPFLSSIFFFLEAISGPTQPRNQMSGYQRA
jgi:hypothetical protein